MNRILTIVGMVILAAATSTHAFADTYASSLAHGCPWTDGISCWGLAEDCYPDNGSAACGDGRWFVTLNSTPIMNLSITLTGLTSVVGGGGLSSATSSMTVMEQLNWMGGTLAMGGNSFTLMPGCISTIDAMHNGATLTNHGFMHQTGVIRNDATITNAADGEWVIDLPGDSYFMWADSTLINQGLMRKVGAAAVNPLGGPLFHITDTGAFVVEGGTFTFGNTVSTVIDGELEALAGTTVNFSQVVSFGELSKVEGAGTFRFLNGDSTPTDVDALWNVTGLTHIQTGFVNFLSPCITTNYSQCVGTMTGDLTVNGLAIFNGGWMGAPGTTWINGDMIIDSATGCSTAPTVDGRTINLAPGSELEILQGGPGGFNGATLNLPAGTLTTFNTPPSFRIMNATAGSATINNDGVILKTNTGSMHVRWLLMNSGLLDIQQGTLYLETNGLVQTAGETRLWPGVRLNSTPLLPIQIDGGSLTGSGIIGYSVETDVNCDGRLAPGSFGSDGAGQFTISGDVVLGSSAVVDMDLGGTTPGTDHDHVAIARTLTLGGDLELSLINGFENSAMAGDVLVLLTAASHIPSVSGAFTNVASGADLETADGKGVFTIWYGAASPHGNYRVVATNFRPLCPADINGDGVVSVTDLLSQLAAWGPCPGGPCPADIDGDGQVNVSDLLDLLGDWGACP